MPYYLHGLTVNLQRLKLLLSIMALSSSVFTRRMRKTSLLILRAVCYKKQQPEQAGAQVIKTR